MFRFTIRDVLWFTLVVGLVLAIVYIRNPAVGRYQLSLSGQGTSKYFLDTATGQVWIGHPDGSWAKYPSPVMPPPKP
jgi:hypothetical protein